MRELLVEGILEQMREFPCEDPARTYHMFLMMNDQRRHLYPHWENAATHGMQFHVPFFDSQFLETMLTFPLDWGLRHDLYYQWMELFDPAARSVPWQVYPGHKPCPVPSSQQWPTQWANDGKYVLNDRRQSLRLLREIMGTRPFPEFLNRRYLRFVQLNLALGADYSYAVEKARIYRDIWVQTGGRHVWS